MSARTDTCLSRRQTPPADEISSTSSISHVLLRDHHVVQCTSLVPYRKLALNSPGNTVNRLNTQTICNYREVVEKPLYKCTSEGLMHVAAWCHGPPDMPRTKVHENREINFNWLDPQRCQISSRSDKRCARSDHLLWKKFAPRKVGQSSSYMSPDLSIIDRPYTSFYRHSELCL